MKVLIITHAYAPDGNPRAYRWTAIAEHWAAAGEHVDVLTTGRSGGPEIEKINGVTVHREGERAIGRLRRAIAGGRTQGGRQEAPENGRPHGIVRTAYDALWKSVYWPDYACTWYIAARRAALRLCGETGYDAVISVSHPFTGHLAGLAVKKRLPRILWIADTGDPFSLDGIIPQNNTLLYRWLNRATDRRVLRGCDSMPVTVAALKHALDSALPEAGGKVVVVPPLLSLPEVMPGSGYAFEEPDTCNLVYLGRLYGGLRDPEALFVLFAELRRRSPGLRLHLYGSAEECEDALARCRTDLHDSVTVHGPVPRERVPGIMAAADILVNLGNDSATQLPSKIVEYAAAGKPILNIARREDDTARQFLTGYPAAFTLVCEDGLPTEQQVADCAAFLQQPPRVMRESAAAFVADHRIEPIAARYAALARGCLPSRRIEIDAPGTEAGGAASCAHGMDPLRTPHRFSGSGSGGGNPHNPIARAHRAVESLTADRQERNRLWWEDLPMTYAEWSAGDRVPRTRADFEAVRAALIGHSPFLRERYDFSRQAGRAVLDLGCGSGVTSCLFAEAGAIVTAADLTQAAVDVTARAAEAWGVPLRIARVDAESMGFADGSFDYVFSWGVLHHTSDPDRAFREVRRVLRGGGRGLVMVYHKASLVYYLKGLYWLLLKGKLLQGFNLETVQSFYVDGYYHRHYTRRTLREALEAAGLTVDGINVTQMQKKILPLIPRGLDLWLKDRVGWLIIAEFSKEAARP